MVRVVNRHAYKGNGVYVGRPSALGNPFKLKSAGGNYDRGETLDCYREWLREQRNENHIRSSSSTRKARDRADL
jgi:hypothetical protein